jgi:outer membrane protein TolC
VVLSRHTAALRAAGAKAWNVYSVFLIAEQVSSRQRAIERIEEDYALTRKIARVGVRTPDDLERALLPLPQ